MPELEPKGEPWQPWSKAHFVAEFDHSGKSYGDSLDIMAFGSFAQVMMNQPWGMRVGPKAMRELAELLNEGADIIEARTDPEVYTGGPTD